MSIVLHSWRIISSPLGTCMKNLDHNQENIETNQANLGASLKNLETPMGQLAQYVR